MAGLSVVERLDALDEAIAMGGAVLPEDLRQTAMLVADRAGERLRLSEQHTVVALAGSTGSGKSSLLNALAGREVSAVDVRRPTTSTALAAVRGTDGVDPLLAWLGVSERVGLDDAPTGEGLVLLDLPDHDSVEVAHRLEAERLVALVDLMVWVVDPQKYADAAVHAYLRALTAHAGVVLVVLNQIDRLDRADRAAAMADLRRLLVADGLPGVRLLAVSARTGEGIDDLRTALDTAAAECVAARDRLEADIVVVADRVVEACASKGGPVPPSGSDADLVESFGAAAGVPRVVEATRASWVREARQATGWPPTRWLARFRADPLRRLHLGPRHGSSSQADPAASRRGQGAMVSRTSLPPAGPAQLAIAHTAARRWMDLATTALPDPWVVETRTAVGTLDDLADDLDLAVAAAPIGRTRRPVWWSVLGLLQWVLLAVLVAGALWLGGLAILGALAVAAPEPPVLGSVPIPTLALLGGALAGLVVAGLGRLLAALGGRRAARQATAALRRAVTEVAAMRVTAPVAAVLDRHHRCRAAALRAAGRPGTRRRRGDR